ncbi:hypothetical protein Glove_79g127 [Diversispora epigaea]|uniref:Uncharacterized protein n=1 Tax=Diversispora epigaea TaxID=1348612 RepID=A0A397J983_9GLOM|nr:hypothetical protein Glove_79g127 [Diversispora epigaea]
MFAGLFVSTGISNYSVSVVQYPKFEEKLDDDEKRKDFRNVGVEFIKQNITGNVIDVNNLKLQVKVNEIK